MSFNASETISERYTGKFYRRLFRSEETGYCVMLYINGNDTTTVVGTDLPEANYPVTFAGRWVSHKEHGLQFEADIVVKQIPSKRKDIITMISTAGVGIGKKKAEKMLDLVAEEGDAFWNEVTERPETFHAVVNRHRVKRLSEKVQQLMFMENIAKVCGTDLKFDTIRYKRICVVFQDDLGELPEMIMENPFILIRAGFGFAELDAFGVKHTTFMVNDHRRLLGACLQVLMDSQGKCHSALPKAMVMDGMDSLLRKQGRVNADDLEIFLSNACQNGEIVMDNELVYLNRSYQEENVLVNCLIEMSNLPPDNINPTLFNAFLVDYEKEKGFQLSTDQKNAVWMAMTQSICVITGGPGTGKSTILDAIRACWRTFRPAESCMLLAPTGRAAVRMAEVTNEPAGTIHSGLQLIVGSTSVEEMDEVTTYVDTELVIVDESSMVDQSTAAALLGSLRGRYKNKRQHLILVGDPDQLPSVSYGNVLSDIIASGAIPVARLGTVYRQAADNPIVANSGRIRDGITDLIWSQSFRGYHNGTEEANKLSVCKFYCACVKKHGAENVILLSPYHSKTGVSTDALNKELQNALNPDQGQPSLPHGKRVFRLGDRVMMLKNTDTLNNGDIGVVTSVTPTTTEDNEAHLMVTFENGVEHKFPKENLFQLDLAYGLTVHKSQGGQYKIVIMILPNNTSPFLQRNVVYTAVTRSKEYFAVFGPPEVLAYAIRNNKYGKRYTGLTLRLQTEKARLLQAA